MKISMTGNPSYFFEDLAPGCFFICPSYSDGLFMKTITTADIGGELYNTVSFGTGLSLYFGSETSVIPVFATVDYSFEPEYEDN